MRGQRLDGFLDSRHTGDVEACAHEPALDEGNHVRVIVDDEDL
jgi:hypothetical protein